MYGIRARFHLYDKITKEIKATVIPSQDGSYRILETKPDKIGERKTYEGLTRQELDRFEIEHGLTEHEEQLNIFDM